MTDTGFVVVGGGSIGRRHARNLEELGATVVVADPDDETRGAIASEHGFRTYASLADALESERLDVAVVATPNRYHVENALEAARAGCHLFIEKPLSHRMEGVGTLESLATERELVTLVGCNLRFQPELRKIYRLLGEEKPIGTPVAARIEGGSYLPGWFLEGDYRDSYSAREDLGGGVTLDYIHEINYARWCFGEFDTVTAMLGQRTSLDVETNDVASIIGETVDGTVCEFHLDYVQRPYSRSCHVIGEEGTIRWSWRDERVTWYVASEDQEYSFERPDDWELNDMYMREMEHFLDCVHDGCETTCCVDCGAEDLATVLAARESARSGRHVSVRNHRI